MSGKARILSAVIDGEPQWHALVRWLDEAGAEGVHTHDMHRAFIANAGQRKPEVEKNTGRTVISVRESRNGKPGARYFWAEFAPPDSPAQVCGASPADTGRLPAEPSGLIPNVAKRGLAAALAEFDEEDGDDWWEAAA